MIAYLNQLFERAAEEESERRRPAPEIDDRDVFGRELLNYQARFPSAEADALLPHLFELGRGTHPVHDLRRFKQSAGWPQHDGQLRFILDDWWNVLRRLMAQMRHDRRTQAPRRAYCGPLDRHHLPLARAVVWLQIYHEGREIMPDLLKFLSNCLTDYPNCPEVTRQLAQSAANMLVREPYFRQWKPRIAFQYPELMKGRIGGRLHRA